MPETVKDQLSSAINPIKDKDSFEEVTAEPRQIAGLYFYYILDCLIELAYKVSNDFFKRPHLYTDVGPTQDSGVEDTIAPTIAKLNAEYGTDPYVLNCEQRTVIYTALFGQYEQPGSETGDFSRLRDELLLACAKFVETKFGDVDSLRINVQQKHRLLKEYLDGLQGLSVRWSIEAFGVLTEEISYRILRDRGVAAVFTGALPPKIEWPYDFDSNAAKLVEEISKRLGGISHIQQQPEEGVAPGEPYPVYITRELETNLQRVAIEGANALATIIDLDPTNIDTSDVDFMIRQCYTWYTALKNLKEREVSINQFLNTNSHPISRVKPGIAIAQPLPKMKNE